MSAASRGRHVGGRPIVQLKRVTVVDDDISLRESLADLLSALGYAASAFASAKELLAAEDIGETDCLIVDVTMPGMSGPDLARELRRRGHDVPVIFMTAQRDEINADGLRAQGAVACLFKPFSDTPLLEALAAALPD